MNKLQTIKADLPHFDNLEQALPGGKYWLVTKYTW